MYLRRIMKIIWINFHAFWCNVHSSKSSTQTILLDYFLHQNQHDIMQIIYKKFTHFTPQTFPTPNACHIQKSVIISIFTLIYKKCFVYLENMCSSGVPQNRKTINEVSQNTSQCYRIKCVLCWHERK